MEPFKWIWGYIREYKFRMFFALFLTLSVAAINMVNPYLSGIIVDKVILGGETNLLLGFLALMTGAVFLKALIRYLYQMIFEFVSQNAVFNIRKTIYSRLQEMDFDFFDRTKTGDIMARMTGDSDMVRHFTAWVIYQIFENAMLFIFAMYMLFSINLKFALLLIAMVPVSGFLSYKLAGEVRPTFFAVREQFSRLNSVVQENIAGNRVVKAFAKEDYEIEKFERENAGFKEKNLISSSVWEKYLPTLDSMAGMLLVIMIIAGGIFVIKGYLTVGELVTFNSFVWALNNPMRMAGWLINDTQRFVAASAKIRKLIEEEPKIKNPDEAVVMDAIKGMVEFRSVGFSYGDEKVLENISFTAKPGQTVAIIGPTGSGKSTLVSLICRFYDCTSGQILVDGNDIKEMNIRALRESIAVAMQDIFLFSDTIEGNIAYGAPDASVDQVEWAAEVAGASEFIQNFPEGYDTIVGERGVGLSGGQKQRIALARALLKNPSILILDDTTSSVDIETEHEIHKSLKSFYKEKTTFIIAHRISSVKNADLILVVDDGRIIEKGKHDRLLEQKGYYYSVFLNQFGDFDNIYADNSEDSDCADVSASIAASADTGTSDYSDKEVV